jgi:hypothetical protein
MTNLLAQAINCDDPNQAARIIRDALGIESDDVVNYCFPTTWPTDRERRRHLPHVISPSRFGRSATAAGDGITRRNAVTRGAVSPCYGITRGAVSPSDVRDHPACGG